MKGEGEGRSRAGLKARDEGREEGRVERRPESIRSSCCFPFVRLVVLLVVCLVVVAGVGRSRLVDSLPAVVLPNFLDVGRREVEGGKHGVLEGLQETNGKKGSSVRV